MSIFNFIFILSSLFWWLELLSRPSERSKTYLFTPSSGALVISSSNLGPVSFNKLFFKFRIIPAVPPCFLSLPIPRCSYLSIYRYRHLDSIYLDSYSIASSSEYLKFPFRLRSQLLSYSIFHPVIFPPYLLRFPFQKNILSCLYLRFVVQFPI